MAPWTWDVMQRKRRESVVSYQLSRWIKHFRANHFSFNLDFLNRFEFLTKRSKHYVVVTFSVRKLFFLLDMKRMAK